MTTSRIRRLILAVYPASFRERYGEELTAVAKDSGDGWRVDLDLAVSAVRARLDPGAGATGPEGRRLRLEATTATVFSLWVWSAVAVALFARAVDDKPVPGLRAWGWSAYAVGQAIFELSGLAILVVGFAFWLRVVVSAAITRDRATLMPALVPVAAVLVWLAGTGMVAVAAHHIQVGYRHRFSGPGPHTAGGWVLLVLYALLSALCVTVATISVRRALRSAKLTARTLGATSLVAASASIALAAVTACAVTSLTRVLLVGGIGVRDQATAVAAVGFLLLASVTAAASSTRGLLAIRTPPARS